MITDPALTPPKLKMHSKRLTTQDAIENLFKGISKGHLSHANEIAMLTPPAGLGLRAQLKDLNWLPVAVDSRRMPRARVAVELDKVEARAVEDYTRDQEKALRDVRKAADQAQRDIKAELRRSGSQSRSKSQSGSTEFQFRMLKTKDTNKNLNFVPLVFSSTGKRISCDSSDGAAAPQSDVE
jgi:hypothetical protein